MGKIVASYLVKVHLHEPDEASEVQLKDVTNDQVKTAVIDGVADEFGTEVTVSLVERTDD